MANEHFDRIGRLEASDEKQWNEIAGLKTREAVREVKVQAVRSAMNRLTVLFGTLIATVLGALIAAYLTGGPK